MTKLIFLGGLAAGTAEVVWVMLFCLMSPLQSSLVAEEIARSFLPHAAGLPAVVGGLAIHYGLSVLLAGILGVGILRMNRRSIDASRLLLTSVAALSAIWAINFFLVLPSLNPTFATLLPYGVSLASKLMFGIALGWVLTVGVGLWKVKPV